MGTGGVGIFTKSILKKSDCPYRLICRNDGSVATASLYIVSLMRSKTELRIIYRMYLGKKRERWPKIDYGRRIKRI
jgi:hypothetical protein